MMQRKTFTEWLDHASFMKYLYKPMPCFMSKPQQFTVITERENGELEFEYLKYIPTVCPGCFRLWEDHK